MIIVDTREQLPLWEEKEFKIIRKKLDEGDYTTEELYEKAHIERKSAIDLYGSLIQGHERFRAEIQRAIDKDLSFAVFVECTKEKFISMKFKGAHRLRVKPRVLTKIINTFMSRYPVEFIWCNNRADMKKKALLWFAKQEEEIKNE